MPLTNTSHLPSLTLSLPAGPVKFTFPDPSASNPTATTISIPPGSKWSPSPHWHETHVEYLRILKGRVWVKTDKVVREVGPQDGDIKIDKFVVHDFGRADRGHGDDEVVVMEWTDPSDGFKEVFFRNVMSVFAEADGKITPSSGLQLLTTIAYVDNWPAIPFLPQGVGYYVSHALLGFGGWLGWAFGYRPWYEEYTPERVRGVAGEGGKAHLRVKGD